MDVNCTVKCQYICWHAIIIEVKVILLALNFLDLHQLKSSSTSTSSLYLMILWPILFQRAIVCCVLHPRGWCALRV